MFLRRLFVCIVILIGCQISLADEGGGGSSVAETAEKQAAQQVGPRALSKAFRNAASTATPSVVTIFAYGQPKLNPTITNRIDEKGKLIEVPEKQPTKNDLTGIGSGVIVSDGGLVITNNHVIASAKRVKVQLSDESEIFADMIKGDPDSDVAVLRIKRDSPFVGAGIADSDAIEVGDWVLAIGSPFRLEATVSAGIISAKNRPVERIKRGRLLQTDAAINPGNSGGPLIDLDGNVVGISTAIATRNGGYQGIGFAIPINHAKWIADELDQHGQVRRAAIGASLVSLKPRIANQVKLPAYLGVLVYQTIKDSAAERAGFEQLDVILEFAGERVRSPESLQDVIERKPIGSTQEVKVFRKGKEVMLKVEIASAEDTTLTAKKEEKDAEASGEKAEDNAGEDEDEEMPADDEKVTQEDDAETNESKSESESDEPEESESEEEIKTESETDGDDSSGDSDADKSDETSS